MSHSLKKGSRVVFAIRPMPAPQSSAASKPEIIDLDSSIMILDVSDSASWTAP